MEITKSVSAGSLGSSDVLVTLGPGQKGCMDIMVKSIVEKQFGRRIRKIAEDLFARNDITEAMVRIQGKGALECTLRARLETAIERARD
ncbi:MAG TPA: citrate lyase acyl carrier protein [Synergistales bacterium]|nr:citrate lyase acyl carrier protein [Synergistales bacterium]